MSTSVSTVYNFGMPTYVYVQVVNTEKPARIRADKAEEKAPRVGGDPELILTLGEGQVGKFKPAAFLGWWMQDESS